jgi:p-hydroxybenzoate 3-monooxygenase
MDREGLRHGGIYLCFDNTRHHIPINELTNGRSVMIYGQTEVVKDLIGARSESGAPLLFECGDVAVDGLEQDEPVVRFTHDGSGHELRCDIVAGCDGFHGICRAAMPDGHVDVWQREYPYAWLGILADVAPSTDELIYAYSERGFALHSLRSPRVSRLYLQVDPGEDIADWPDDRIWAELRARFATSDGWQLRDGPILEKAITPMRSFVAEPMRHDRLFLAGDAAHIVPPTGAKGLNLAISDVTVLAGALGAWYDSGSEELIDAYSATCLKRVWRAQHFASWMTTLLHRDPAQDSFGHRQQLAHLEYLAASTAAATTLAENYVGVAPTL